MTSHAIVSFFHLHCYLTMSCLVVGCVLPLCYAIISTPDIVLLHCLFHGVTRAITRHIVPAHCLPCHCLTFFLVTWRHFTLLLVKIRKFICQNLCHMFHLRLLICWSGGVLTQFVTWSWDWMSNYVHVWLHVPCHLKFWSVNCWWCQIKFTPVHFERLMNKGQKLPNNAGRYSLCGRGWSSQFQ